MPIVLKYVKLYSQDGRLLTEISRVALPAALPEIIEHDGKIFVRPIGAKDFSERPVYHYDEKADTDAYERDKTTLQNLKQAESDLSA